MPAQELPRTVLPDPDPIKTAPVTFGQATIGGKKVYTLDESNFSALGSNLGEVARWISEAKYRLECYATNAVCAAEKPAENAK